MLAEDLNVAFPLSYWVTEAFASPKTARQGAVPGRRSEARSRSIRRTSSTRSTPSTRSSPSSKKPHTLGAFFVLNHQTVLDAGVPPVRAIAERVHKEGGLIELDKHNWPWSMMLVPVAKVDLYELANNHVWRTEFGFGDFGEPAPEYMKVERDTKGFTERGWIDYGFQNYYALLNCGFRLRPTAGTASGVHPVPLGFGRVYVNCPESFSYDAWVRGLDRGRELRHHRADAARPRERQEPGHDVQAARGQAGVSDHGGSLSALPLDRMEIVVNGEVAAHDQAGKQAGASKAAIRARSTRTDASTARPGSRCAASNRCPKNRVRFAHTAPFHIEVPGKPLRPRPAEIDFLIRRVEEQYAQQGRVAGRGAGRVPGGSRSLSSGKGSRGARAVVECRQESGVTSPPGIGVAGRDYWQQTPSINSTRSRI